MKTDWLRHIGPLIAEGGSASPSLERIPAKADFVKAMGSESLLQGEEGEARGEFDPATNLIRLMKTAAPSTFPHELAHFILESAFRHVWKGKAGADHLENWCRLLGAPSSGGTSYDAARTMGEEGLVAVPMGAFQSPKMDPHRAAVEHSLGRTSLARMKPMPPPKKQAGKSERTTLGRIGWISSN